MKDSIRSMKIQSSSMTKEQAVWLKQYFDDIEALMFDGKYYNNPSLYSDFKDDFDKELLELMKKYKVEIDMIVSRNNGIQKSCINPRLNKLDAIYQALAPKTTESEQKKPRKLLKGVQQSPRLRGESIAEIHSFNQQYEHRITGDEVRQDIMSSLAPKKSQRKKGPFDFQ